MAPKVPRLNARVLTVWLLVALPGLAVGVAFVLAFGQARLSDSYAHHLQQLAQQTAAGVDAYVYRRILDVSVVARTPDLRRAATAASARPFDRAAAEAVDRQWQGAGGPPKIATEILDTPASQYLRDLVAHDRIYRELILTDRDGRLVAASNMTSDYYQGDEDWWITTRDDGRRGRVTVTDVRWDNSARIHAIEIAVPVSAPGSEDLVGVLKAVTDSREMLALVGSVQLGETGTAWLLRRNGSVVFSRHAGSPGSTYWAADLVKSRIETLQSGSIGGASFEAQGADGVPQIVGLAESQLATSFPNVAWVIAVGQARDELLAPVRVVGWYLLALVATFAIVVLALALWFSIELAAPQVDVDMHLVQHPAVSHVGELSNDAAGQRATV